jgi:molybdopterin/thiamine biosynthesis adenylyltransferase
MGCLEALEALKFITGMPVLLKNRLLVWEGDLAQFEEIRIERDPSCPVCSKPRALSELQCRLPPIDGVIS